MPKSFDFTSVFFPTLRPQNEVLDWKLLFSALEDPLWDLFQQSRLQEPSTIWSLRFSFALAQDLVNEKGQIDLTKLQDAIVFLKNHKYIVCLDSNSIAYRLLHIRRVLHWLEEDAYRSRFEKINRGRGHFGIENLLKLSAQAAGAATSESFYLSDRWVRVCVLSAWFHYIRQVVGSCFATAPAILIQQHQPENFLKDFQQILENGHLKRTFDGKELQVPAAEDSGIGDLRKRFALEPSLIHAPGLVWALSKVCNTDQSVPTDDLKEESTRLLVAQQVFAQDGYLCAQNLIESYLCKRFEVNRLQFQEYLKRPKQQVASGAVLLETSTKETSLETIAAKIQLAQEYFCCLTEHPLQRSWEFTLASFSDTRTDYCLWSLHTSLGLNPNEPEGLAERLFQILDEKVKEYNEKTAQMQPRCEDMDYQVQHVAVRLQSAKDDRELSWLRAEYQNVKAERDQLLQERDSFHQKANAFANLFHALLDEYIRLFESYFQQVYDPQMRDAAPGPYEDSPAGFRLVFKSGRSSASSWISIQNGAQYIDSVARFLIITEQEILSQQAFEVIRDDLSHIVTLLVQHIRSERFLTKSFERMVKGLGMSLDVSSVELQEKSLIKPWSYISGGTMSGLVSHYYARSEPAQEKKSWFQDIQELWVFLIDTMKDMPTVWSERFRADPTLPLLMHSSQHAFLFLPGHPTFIEGWNHSGYPYTWIRDSYIGVVRDFYSACFLEPEAQLLVFEALKKETGVAFSFEVNRMSPRLRPYDLRRELIKKASTQLSQGWILESFSEKLDSLLLRLLPIHDLATARRKLQEVCLESTWLAKHLSLSKRESIWRFCEKRLDQTSFVTAEQVLKCFNDGLREQIQGPASSPLNPLELKQELARFGLLLPLPVFFADTNWDHYVFAFVLSPGTDELEIWRMKPDSHIGYPMTDWKNQFHEMAQNSLWGIYHNPQDYLAIGWES